MGGIHGCGVPSERANATLSVLKSEECTILFADTHTLRALPQQRDGMLPYLRGGAVKVGSGSDFLDDQAYYSGTLLKTVGKRDCE